MAQTKYTVHHHDGTKEVVEDGSFNAEKHLENMMNPDVTHIAVGGQVYHKGSIKKIVKSSSEVKEDDK